jgi:hypothetical protein
MKMIFAILEERCGRGWRFHKSQCLFIARILMGALIFLNCLSVLMFFWDVEKIEERLNIPNEYKTLCYLGVGLFFSFLLSIIYPKKVIHEVIVTEEHKRKYSRAFSWYMAFTFLLFIVAIFFRGPELG